MQTNTKDGSKSEDELLKDLESSTHRIYNQAVLINEEAESHSRLLGDMDGKLEKATTSLKTETKNTEMARNQKRGKCTLYLIILFEAVVLGILLYIGLN
mmetsp:Transcript_12113/g.12185  ORF Transcript_12113/g.12185 Transcript_12113/m.12185 type:complete len:99 (+) Transcript_12113:107-403(+)